MANAIKVQLGTPLIFKNTGGDYVLTLKNLGNGAGRISARAYLGAAPRPSRYDVRVGLTTASLTVSPSNLFWVYASTSDGTTEDGDVGTADAAVSAQSRLYNCRLVGVLTPDVGSGTTLQGSFRFDCDQAYLSVCVWNALGVALANTDGTSVVTVTPVYDEVQ
jgi:hypothetical protein